MSATTETIETTGKKSKKGLVIIILVAVIAIGGGGGAWFFLQNGNESGKPESPKEIPTTFLDLDVFTVNLQPEENNQYLQVGLTVKIRETNVADEIKKQMPEIRNHILMLLSSKQAIEISSKEGKQQLGSEITTEIRQSLSPEEIHEDVLNVLFTSFVIQ
tara:strand:+ start:197 stop:676 length:480 start_codon:yes stop_codon:yes gene_type:complete